MSIQIRQSKENWFVKLYHETWRVPRPQLEQVLARYSDFIPAHVSLKLEPAHYLVNLPEEEIPCKTMQETIELVTRLLELKNNYGKLNLNEGEQECK